MMFLIRQVLLACLLLMIAAARADVPTDVSLGGMMNRSEVENLVHRGHSNIADVVDVSADDFVKLHNATAGQVKVEKVALLENAGMVVGVAACFATACAIIAMPVYCGGLGRNSKVCTN